MLRLTRWQLIILALPILLIAGFLLLAAGWQIHAWGINWIWAVVTLLLLGWRWLLVRWTQPSTQLGAALTQVNAELVADLEASQTDVGASSDGRVEAALQSVLQASEADLAIWEDWPTFWQRCQSLVAAVAQIYYPDVKYPLLNIYVPQAYGLIRGTVDDLDLWMRKLSPVLGQVTIGQGYQAYEVYRKLEPSARKLWQTWSLTSWLLNPAAALANQISQPYANQANQQLLVNLGQSLREAALRNLARQAVLLYSNQQMLAALPQTQTLREILAEADPVEQVEQPPVNILLVGRTGAGKSSLINSLFETELAQVDLLPSTDKIESYRWQSDSETLILWDSPGYEQADRSEFRQQVLDYAKTADLLLLLTPALDPALQMDLDFLRAIKAALPGLPALTLVTQVDRLRPLREWQPPYDWQWGERPKEIAIREAVTYRSQLLGEFCDRLLPIVAADSAAQREAWGTEALSVALVERIAPAKQFRLARFLRDLEARSLACTKIIDRYALQISTAQGLTLWLKSPVLGLIAKGLKQPAVSAFAAQIPVEQAPAVIGKLQMAYDLAKLLKPAEGFDLRRLGPLALRNDQPADRSIWALGQALVEYWAKSADEQAAEQLQIRYQYYLGAGEFER